MCKSAQKPTFKSFILIILILLVLLPAISFASISVTTHWGSPQYAPPYEPGNISVLKIIVHQTIDDRHLSLEVLIYNDKNRQVFTDR